VRELDCWEGLGSNRTSDQANVTRSKAVEYYGLGKRKRCQILGDSGHVVDAQIIPESKNTLLILVDLEPEDVDSPRNVLRLHNDIERAFDNKDVMFEFDSATTSFTLRVMNPDIEAKQLKDRTETFLDINGRTLVLPNGNLPFRRVMAIHSFFVRRKWSMDMDEAEIRSRELLSFSMDDDAQTRIANFLKLA